MLLLIAVAFGILSILNINLDMMPNMNIPIAIVMTSYSGAGPAEIETLITRPLEGVLCTVPNVSALSSYSSYGSSIVLVEFEDDTNIDNAAIDMRERVDMIKAALPDAAGDPQVLKIDINSQLSITLGFSSDTRDLGELKRLLEDRVTNRIERQEGVAQVSLSGGSATEISLVLNEEQLRGYGISESTVTQLLAAENRSTPAGSIKQGDQRLNLRVTGEFLTVEEIADIPFTTARGGIVHLRDIAEITETPVEVSSVSYINGSPSVTMTVQKQSTANTVSVSDAVMAELDRVLRDYPDMHVQVILDPAAYIRRTLSTVVNSGIQGGLLAVLILLIFLRNFRSTLIVAAAIPVSVVSTFALMYYSKMTLNLMSLGGLMLGIGMLVDNSIVVLESIYRKIEEGEERFAAAIDGAREVAVSVTASTLTTIAVFLPITFAGGLTAQIFNQLSMTISFSLISSLVVALTFVPMACSLLLRPEDVSTAVADTSAASGAAGSAMTDMTAVGADTADAAALVSPLPSAAPDSAPATLTSATLSASPRAGRSRNPIRLLIGFVGFLIEKLESGYSRLLAVCLRRRLVTLLVVAAFVAFTYVMFAGFVGMEFMPASDESAISIGVSMPRGTLLEETEKTAFLVADAIDGKYPEVSDITIRVGGGGGIVSIGGGSSDSATLDLTLVGKAERTRSAVEVASAISRGLSEIAGPTITVEAVSQSMGNYGGGGGIQLTIYGDQTDGLGEVAEDVRAMIASVPGTRETETSVQDATPQATLRINRDKASGYGISAYTIAGVINTAISGTVATTFKTGDSEMDIRVRQNRDSFNYITDLENILIPSPTGVNVPLYELAEIVTEDMPETIARSNQRRYVTVSAQLEGRDAGAVMADVKARLAAYPMPDGFSWEEAGTTEQMNETFADLGLALIMALALVYMIMAAEFESLAYPFIIMFSIPIALTGGLFGLFLFGTPLSITGFLGLIMLAGVVINNAIVLVDYTNLLIRERGMSGLEALKTAGPVRMRPILMTTLTTVLALIPMMFATSDGAEMMRGLAVVVVFGLSLSTLVTLLFVPVVYLFFYNGREKRRKKREARLARSANAAAGKASYD
jgi:HAE1 family hydrophobic/amphiphilic exporter-1